jgi:hypothetical protein
MYALPFGRGVVWRHVPHTEAANVAADLMGADDRLVPRAVVGHRALDAEFAGVAIDNDPYKGAAGHPDAPAGLLPGSDGAAFSREWKEALWAKFSTEAPRRQRRSVERDRPTPISGATL